MTEPQQAPNFEEPTKGSSEKHGRTPGVVFCCVSLLWASPPIPASQLGEQLASTANFRELPTYSLESLMVSTLAYYS